MMAQRMRTVIIGAAGMDYHVFNRVYRHDPTHEILAFTMAVEQNLGTVEGEMRKYPPELAGPLYPQGIPTIPENQLETFVKTNHVQLVVLAYSDIAYPDVMHKASRALAAGADFRLISPLHTMIKSTKPIIAVCAVRTGCGKSQTSRKLVQMLKNEGLRVVAIREPMPYGDLVKQECMRFATHQDLVTNECTIEELEEYEGYVDRGLVIYSGVDYETIIRQAEREADVIVWDGGNNEVSFYVPDVLLVVADPLRVGHEAGSYPGEVNVRLADYLIINKEDTATPEAIQTLTTSLTALNPNAKIIHANSPPTVAPEAVDLIKGKRVLVVEDGPTLTHGNMAIGAGYVAAQRYGANQMVRPQPYLEGAPNLAKVFKEFDQLQDVLPAMGYSKDQLKEMEDVINKVDCDVVLAGTPIDLTKVIKVNKPVVRVSYELEEFGPITLKEVLADLKEKTGLAAHVVRGQ
eukprot:comp19834_c0_seq1/m.23874 comp19834_c0_seq1/g.23874  ORF comp19834_c0_seq1/g.23874 comp19834_c0_seq1/m.23874 type:complete len:462 (-) comp19834_c0_seq1:136-1521(-)